MYVPPAMKSNERWLMFDPLRAFSPQEQTTARAYHHEYHTEQHISRGRGGRSQVGGWTSTTRRMTGMPLVNDIHKIEQPVIGVPKCLIRAESKEYEENIVIQQP